MHSLELERVRSSVVTLPSEIESSRRTADRVRRLLRRRAALIGWLALGW